MMKNDLRGHTLQRRCGRNNLFILADTGSSTTFMNKKQPCYRKQVAKLIQITVSDKTYGTVCYNVYQNPFVSKNNNANRTRRMNGQHRLISQRKRLKSKPLWTETTFSCLKFSYNSNQNQLVIG